MSNEAISLADARAILAKLIEVQKNDPIGAIGSISENGRSISFKSSEELIGQINYWTNLISQLQQRAAGAPTFGRSAAVFTR